MRGKRGITLVSLVVTIIVLIILAGVSINLTVGENGIITIAKKARENMELATIEEETRLNALYTQIELEDGNIGGIDNNSISKLIEFKQKVASAITDMGIETLETANADTMASNIRNISTSRDASSISYDNTNSELISTTVQGAVDELDSEIDNLNNLNVIIDKALIGTNALEINIPEEARFIVVDATVREGQTHFCRQYPVSLLKRNRPIIQDVFTLFFSPSVYCTNHFSIGVNNGKYLLTYLQWSATDDYNSDGYVSVYYI